MQINAQDMLPLLESSGNLVFFDTEASGLRGDYNSALVYSVKVYGNAEIKSFVVENPGDDKKISREVRDYLEQFTCWVTYYGKGFDIPFLRTRLLRHRLRPLEKRHHIDMYYSLKSNILTARRSQGHLLSFLETPQEKMGVSANVWNEVCLHPQKNLKILRERCESDVEGLEALYERTKLLIGEITR